MRFHAKELSLARKTSESTMTSTLSRKSISRTPDGEGGYTETPTMTSLTRFPYCRFCPISAIERVFANRLDTKKRYRVFTPHDFEAGSGDTLVIDGVDYFVEADLKPQSPDEIGGLYEVYLIE